MHELVAVGQERSAQRLEDAGLVRRLKWSEKIRSSARARLRLVLVVPVGAVPGPAAGDFLRRQAEQEEILYPRLLRV